MADGMAHHLARQQRPRFDDALPLGAKRDRELGARRLFHGHRAGPAVLRRPHMAALRPRRTPDVTEAGTVSGWAQGPSATPVSWSIQEKRSCTWHGTDD